MLMRKEHFRKELGQCGVKRDECFRLYRKLIGIIQIIVFRDKSAQSRAGPFPSPSGCWHVRAQKPVAEETGNKKQDQGRHGNPGSSGPRENCSEGGTAWFQNFSERPDIS